MLNVVTQYFFNGNKQLVYLKAESDFNNNGNKPLGFFKAES